MFSGLPPQPSPAHSAAELAALALTDECALRLPRFSASDAVTLGLSLRKRFRGGARHARAGVGALVGVYDALGHTLFACTVGDLADTRGAAGVGLDAWTRVAGMTEAVRRTGHCTFYIEKGMQAVNKSADQLGIRGDVHIAGGAFPLWLDNAPSCPIAIVVLHSGDSAEDHRMVVTAIRDTIRKMNAPPASPEPADDAGPVHRVPAPGVLAELHAPARTYRERSEGSGSANGHGSASGHGSQHTYREPSAGSVQSASPGGSQLGHEPVYDSRQAYDTRGRQAYAASADYYESPEREQWRQPAMAPAYRAGLDQ